MPMRTCLEIRTSQVPVLSTSCRVVRARNRACQAGLPDRSNPANGKATSLCPSIGASTECETEPSHSTWVPSLTALPSATSYQLGTYCTRNLAHSTPLCRGHGTSPQEQSDRSTPRGETSSIRASAYNGVAGRPSVCIFHCIHKTCFLHRRYTLYSFSGWSDRISTYIIIAPPLKVVEATERRRS
jgi:hypothetical protein